MEGLMGTWLKRVSFFHRSQSSPVEGMAVKEYRELLKWLRLPLVRDLRQEDFARLEARVSPDGESLVFPVRYVPIEGSSSLGSLVGLRKISVDPSGGSGSGSGGLPIVEENVPGPANITEAGRGYAKMMPMPHGLDLAARTIGTLDTFVNIS